MADNFQSLKPYRHCIVNVICGGFCYYSVGAKLSRVFATTSAAHTNHLSWRVIQKSKSSCSCIDSGQHQLRPAFQGPVYLNSGAALSWSGVTFILACHFLSVSW